MTTKRTTKCAGLRAVMIAVSLLGGGAAMAQEWSSPGQNWGGGWGFSSVAERTLLLQQAQAMLAARNAGRVTTINTYDNRQNYQEVSVGAGATNDSAFQVGDSTQSSYAVGALNTGTTNIDVTGDGNTVDSTIRADSTGCIDGTMTTMEQGTPNLDASFGIDISMASSAQGQTCN
ncbi:hypothetical protein [Paragemmobacter straminiformis]|uniref:Curlin associated repeat-containing protein n=1 Tax=Paragemmobacter straminiformis TaxID=2045119 RepID=A0A842I0Q8_9RHOB|nr:hypothetical protein [Gemmobacter straminiformis]MBC2834142.1 hypothetical protein [Gemmobacter straminiformis]